MELSYIVDVTGQFVSKYFNPATDVIFNPLDARSVEWSIWEDCRTDYHFEAFAESIIPPQKNQGEDIWDKSSRIVLVELLKKLKEQQTPFVKELLNVINTYTLEGFGELLAGTNAAKILSKEGERTSHSVLMNLIAHIAPLKILHDGESPFSIRKWVEEEDNNNAWLFITAKTDQIASLRGLISATTDIALNACLSLEPHHTRRLWFIIDELPKLLKLPSFVTGLAEARKYGGCILAGIQSVPQLTDIYGHSVTQAMLDMFNSFFMFRCQNPQTAEWVAKVLGIVEQEELQEQMSYGASQMKDGVSFSKHTKSKHLVLPIEIANLKNLECYVKYASHNVTKIKASFQKREDKYPGFIPIQNHK